MGTPPFAARCLSALIDAGHDVAAVFTRADKPAGRGRAVVPSPVKVLARQRGIPVLTPSTLRGGAGAVEGFSPDCVAVAAYGLLLPPEVLAVPRYGCVNVHASLLPKYRGASPVSAAILSGDTVTGVSTMLMSEGLDEGPVLLQETIPIAGDDTLESLTRTLADVGAGLLTRTLERLETGDITPAPQDPALASYCRTLRKADGLLTGELSARETYNRIRGLYPWPGAYFKAAGKTYKVTGAAPCGPVSGESGTLRAGGGRLVLACNSGAVEITEIQPEGKRRMSAAEFLRGARLPEETRLER